MNTTVDSFLHHALTSKQFELQLPDWTQMKENLNIFDLRPIWDLKLKPLINENNLKENFQDRKNINCKYSFFFTSMLWPSYFF